MTIHARGVERPAEHHHHHHARRTHAVHSPSHGDLVCIRGVLRTHQDVFRRGHRPSEHDRRCHHPWVDGAGPLKSPSVRAEETGGQRPCTQLGEMRLLQRGDQVLRSAFHQRWRVTYPRSSQSSLGVQGTSRRQVTSQLPVYGSVELTVHERRMHGLGTTMAAHKEWSPLAVDRDRTERLQRDKGAHLAKCMGYFRKDWETELISDASQVGLGAVICQFNPADPMHGHIVCIISRLWAETERRYSQTEKVWSCEMAAIWLIGSHFRIVVDNRAVMLIYINAKSKSPARIERWALRLTPFEIEIAHRPGVSNLADYYSRIPGGNGVLAYLEEIKSEQCQHGSASSHTTRNETKREIAEATSLDPELSELRQAITTGKRLSKSLDHYRRMLSELSVSREGIVLRDHRIVIPNTLRKRVVELTHGGHQGIVKTKRLNQRRPIEGRNV
jgi:hypothetical protein